MKWKTVTQQRKISETNSALVRLINCQVSSKTDEE